jgi:hypothetical protein
MHASGTVDGTPRGRTQRGRWIRASQIPYGEELSVRKKQDTYIEDTDRVETERQRLPFDTFGANIEWEAIK